MTAGLCTTHLAEFALLFARLRPEALPAWTVARGGKYYLTHESPGRSRARADASCQPGAGMMLSLRPYQIAALEAVDAAEKRGIRRPLIAHPTGAGKCVVAAHLIARRPGRALFLAHRDELIRQAADKIRLVAPELEVGIVKAGENEVGAPCVVASVQTLARQSRLSRVCPDFRTVVIDESHHAVAESWERVLRYMRTFEPDGPLTCGFTATPERADGAGLGEIFQEIVHRLTVVEMIRAGYLSDLRGQIVGTDADLSKVRTRHGDLVEGELGDELERSGALDQIAAAYVEYAKDRKAIAFTPTVRTAHLLADALCEYGIAAEALSGKTPQDERRAILGRLKDGSTRVVANAAVLTEGFDEPSVDCIVIARPTKSRPLFIQQIGRGTRLYPGKEDCLVLDVTGVSERHDLITLDKLTKTPLKGRTVTEALAARKRPPQASETDVDIERATRTRSVDLLRSRLRWLQAGAGFCLPLVNGTLVLVPSGPDRWAVVRSVKGRLDQLVADDMPLGYAQGHAEDLARKAGHLTSRGAEWLGRPPSEAQLTLLRDRGVDVSQVATRGQASDLIMQRHARGVLRRMRARADA